MSRQIAKRRIFWVLLTTALMSASYWAGSLSSRQATVEEIEYSMGVFGDVDSIPRYLVYKRMSLAYETLEFQTYNEKDVSAIIHCMGILGDSRGIRAILNDARAHRVASPDVERLADDWLHHLTKK